MKPTQAGIKKAAAGTAAKKKMFYSIGLYQKPAQKSSLKAKLLVEIRGLIQGLVDPFLKQSEKDTCYLLYCSTVHKLNILQNSCKGHSTTPESKKFVLR